MFATPSRPPTDFGPSLDAMLAALRASQRVRVREETRQPLSASAAALDAVIQDLDRDAQRSLPPAPAALLGAVRRVLGSAAAAKATLTIDRCGSDFLTAPIAVTSACEAR